MGSCNRGRECSFAHSTDDLQEKPDLYKTKLCTDFMMSGACKNIGECKFAHGKHDLRSAHFPVAHPYGDVGSSSLSKRERRSLADNLVQSELHGVPRRQPRSHHSDLNMLRPVLCQASSSFDNPQGTIWNAAGSVAGKAGDPLLPSGNHRLALPQHREIETLSGQGTNKQVQSERLALIQNTLVSNRSVAFSPNCVRATQGQQEFFNHSHGTPVDGVQAGQSLDMRQQEELYATFLTQEAQRPQGLGSQVLTQQESLYWSMQVEMLSAAIAAVEGGRANSATENTSTASAKTASGFLRQPTANEIASRPAVLDCAFSTRVGASSSDEINILGGMSTEGSLTTFVRQLTRESSDDEGGVFFGRQHTEPLDGSTTRTVVVKNTFIDVAEEDSHTTVQVRRSSSAPARHC